MIGVIASLKWFYRYSCVISLYNRRRVLRKFSVLPASTMLAYSIGRSTGSQALIEAKGNQLMPLLHDGTKMSPIYV